MTFGHYIDGVAVLDQGVFDSDEASVGFIENGQANPYGFASHKDLAFALGSCLREHGKEIDVSDDHPGPDRPTGSQHAGSSIESAVLCHRQ